MNTSKKPSIADLIGETFKEPVKKNIQKVVPIEDKIKEKQFQFYLPESLLDEVKEMAFKRKTKVKKIIVEALNQYLKK